jgi:hypothetical protein
MSEFAVREMGDAIGIYYNGIMILLIDSLGKDHILDLLLNMYDGRVFFIKLLDVDNV